MYAIFIKGFIPWDIGGYPKAEGKEHHRPPSNQSTHDSLVRIIECIFLYAIGIHAMNNTVRSCVSGFRLTGGLEANPSETKLNFFTEINDKQGKRETNIHSNRHIDN